MATEVSGEYHATLPTLLDGQTGELQLDSRGRLITSTSVTGLPPSLGPLPAASALAVVPSGVNATASFTPAAAAYSAGDIISVAQPFALTYADGTAIPSASLVRILTSTLRIDTTALQASEAAYTLHFYSATPPSAQADNAAWTLASADLPSYRGSISLGTPVDLGAALYIKTPYLDLDVRTITSSLYCELVTVAGFTATAVARQVTIYGIVL